MTRRNIESATPVLDISDWNTAKTFYCEKLGFAVDWAYQPNASSVNPAYLGLSREGACIEVSSFPGSAVFANSVVSDVRDVNELFQEFQKNGVTEFALEPYTQSWGNREMYLRDSDGNKLNFIQRQH